MKRLIIACGLLLYALILILGTLLEKICATILINLVPPPPTVRHTIEILEHQGWTLIQVSKLGNLEPDFQQEWDNIWFVYMIDPHHIQKTVVVNSNNNYFIYPG